MKAYKKVFALLLALVMTMALAVTAFAVDEKGSITVKNPKDGIAYTAYKIFDVVYNDGKDAYSYTINSDSEWFTDVQKSDMVNLEQVGESKVYVVTEKNGFSAAKFAAYLKGKTAGKTGKAMADGKVEGLDLGYYLVIGGEQALCNLTTTNPDATILDKNDNPFNKEANTETANVGEKVTYTITGKVPDTTGFTEYKYEVADKMSAGLTFNQNVTIQVGGTELTNNFKLVNNDNGFTLNIDMLALNELGKAGEEIKITYTATVNEKAVTVISENKATLEYSNDPTDGDKTTKTPEVVEKLHVAKIVINKYENGNPEKKLANAKFVLKNADGKFYQYDSVNKVVIWVDAEKDAKVITTDENGAGEFIGLKDGTYTLVETEAPKGYNPLTGPVTVNVNGTNVDVNTLTVTADVANSTGNTLPSTGGIGTTIFYVVGGLLVVGAAVLLISKKRMSATK